MCSSGLECVTFLCDLAHVWPIVSLAKHNSWETAGLGLI